MNYKKNFKIPNAKDHIDLRFYILKLISYWKLFFHNDPYCFNYSQFLEWLQTKKIYVKHYNFYKRRE